MLNNLQSGFELDHENIDQSVYFITICSKDIFPYFGSITEDTFYANKIGTIVDTTWLNITSAFPFIKLGAFIIMPNHIHGILKIDRSDVGYARLIAPLSLKNKTGGFAGKHNPMLNENIARVVRWFKGKTTFEIRKSIPHFSWQKKYFNHCIVDKGEYLKIHEYIIQNPKFWKEDKFYIDV